MLSWSCNRAAVRVPAWLEASSAGKHQLESLSGHLPRISQGKLLREVSSWGVGGPAKLFCEVHHELQLASALSYCNEQSIPFLVIGKGSNCLFDDRGFDGCIILNRLSFLKRLASGVYQVGSGYPFNVLGVQTANDGFTGLEFASGIPGTVGGAVYMNAGADGQETASALKSVEVITVFGMKCKISREELVFGYRSSPFQNAQGFAAISSATFALTSSANSREEQRKFLNRRKQTQPLGERSAGCVFKNPGSGCQSAGSFIDKAGLKGMSIGGAKVSEVHANFITNACNSSAKDMMELISLVKEQVRSKFGVELEEEFIYIPFR
ncbi:hypothetical protein GOP47_0014969 [Adiantum capillus-veneris]|uniref:UDP-N-acetylmuramate dehydrogenase n=1 Tax=Adiantum capillus-veneris TaxID=13818 RepID=A0A9D4UMI8_ADICA|nr:hypothetical protein GOP47_0014969 [Adiantum capillus-veneris]